MIGYDLLLKRDDSNTPSGQCPCIFSLEISLNLQEHGMTTTITISAFARAMYQHFVIAFCT